MKGEIEEMKLAGFFFFFFKYIWILGCEDVGMVGWMNWRDLVKGMGMILNQSLAPFRTRFFPPYFSLELWRLWKFKDVGVDGERIDQEKWCYAIILYNFSSIALNMYL